MMSARWMCNGMLIGGSPLTRRGWMGVRMTCRSVVGSITLAAAVLDGHDV
jgi:hypothetical protein